MDIGLIREYLGNDWTKVQEKISSALRSDIGLLDQMNKSMLDNCGKMLRPLLSLLLARACSADGSVTEDTYSFAAAVEILHNATLFHDDVADKSLERRGKPTLNALIGPSVSVLVGDFWLVRSIGCILGAERGNREVIAAFSKTLSDLAEGEMLQLQKASSCDTAEDDYFKIIYGKTASLFEVAAYSAAVSVDAPLNIRKAAMEFAVKFGLAFQIRDDIFDYTSTMDVGKPLGVDILEQKITLPLLCAFAAASAGEEAAVRELVRNIDGSCEKRDRIVDFVNAHEGCMRAQERLEKLSEEAVETLDILPPSRERQILQSLAVQMAGRTC